METIDVDVYGVPSPPKIKVDHNIQLDSLTINLANLNIIFHSSTLYFVSQTLKLLTSTFKVTVQHSTLSINIHVYIPTMVLAHGLSAKDDVWISKSNVELPKAPQSRQNWTSEFNFQVDNSTSNVTYQYPCLTMNVAIADDANMLVHHNVMFDTWKLVVSLSERSNPAKNPIEAL